MTRSSCTVLAAALGILAAPAVVGAQDGAAQFHYYCASCHEPAAAGAPDRAIMKNMRPEDILRSLETGSMKRQAAERSRAQRRALAEDPLSGKAVPADAVYAVPKSAFCAGGGEAQRAGQAPAAGHAWNGWANGLTNHRYQPADAAGLAAAAVPRLKLKWAFGLPGASSGGTQPVVVGGRMYVATAEGDVYALDARSGCVVWTMTAEAGIRTAVTIGQGDGRETAYFGDQSADVYAVDAATGKVQWSIRVDDHPRAAITGAPQLYEGRLYVPVASREESQVGDPHYPCCEFRGSVVALDASNGRVVWKTYMIDQRAKPTERNSVGTQLFGPSGSPIWSAPTVDARRGALYVGTGNNYSPPATETSDSIVALDLAGGSIRWIHQETENDVWNASCGRPNRESLVCPDKDAPDFDFPGSPLLVDVDGARQLILAAGKAGVVYALDPDDRGKVVWQQRVAKGSLLGGVFWGQATDGVNTYAADGDFDARNPASSGGLSALDLRTGRVVWRAAGAGCEAKSPCKPAQVAAVTAIPGVVFSGTMDGRLRAYSTVDGAVVWEYDTARDFPTVNGVKANGGSLSNGGAAVVDGMVFVCSGYSHHGGILPGNVLLAFTADESAPSEPHR